LRFWVVNWPILPQCNETHLPLAVLGGELADTAAMQELAVTLYVIHGEDKYIQTFRDLEKQEDRAFKDTKKLLSTDPDLVKAGWPALVDEAAGLHDRFVEAGNALIDAARAKDQDGIARKADDLEAVSQEFHHRCSKNSKKSTPRRRIESPWRPLARAALQAPP